MSERSQIVEVRGSDGTVWQTTPPWPELLAGFSPDALRRCGRPIKSSPVRSVYFLSLGESRCVLKIYDAPGMWDYLRARFLTSRARLEWRHLHLLQGLGISVPGPIALGSRGITGYLLLTSIPGARTLKEIVFAAEKPLEYLPKARLWDAVALLLADMHNHKILHRDLHFGNVVCGAEGSVYLLDLHDARACRIMTPSRCLKNLAMFGSSFTLCASGADYLRFLRKYHENCKWLEGQRWDECRRAAHRHLVRYQLAFWDKRAQRCLKGNRYFKKISLAEGTGIRTGDTDLGLLGGLEEAISTAELLKSSRTTVVARTPHGILKKYCRKKKRNAVWDCFRRSRAKRAWLAGYQCLTRGIPTARPLFFIEKRCCRVLRSSYLLTEEIPHAKTAHEYLSTFGPKPDGEMLAHRGKFLRQLGRLVRILHLRGLTHRDLKVNNLLVDPKGTTYIVDMDGLKVPLLSGKRRRIKDLKRLVRSLREVSAITRTDVLRVLSGYLPFAGRRERAWWLKRIL